MIINEEQSSCSPVGVAIIGTGWGCKVQIPAWRHQGLEIVGIWVRNAKKVEDIKSKFAVENVTTEWKDLITHPKVDIVSIVTPTYLHKEMALFALQNKKHVICEKPFALNVSEAKEMYLLAKQNTQLLTWVDHELRFLEMFQLMKQKVAAFGRILSISVDAVMRRDPNHAFGWWDDASLGGGLLGALGSHMIDLISWLTGTRITKVSAQIATQVSHTSDSQPITSDDWYNLNVYFNDTIPGCLNGKCLASVRSGTYIFAIRTEQGTVSFDINYSRGIRPQFTVTTNDGRVDFTYTDTSPPLEAGVGDNVFEKGTWEIGRALKEAISPTGKKTGWWDSLAATWEDGLYIQAVMDAARKSSADNGTYVSIESQLK